MALRYPEERTQIQHERTVTIGNKMSQSRSRIAFFKANFLNIFWSLIRQTCKLRVPAKKTWSIETDIPYALDSRLTVYLTQKDEAGVQPVLTKYR
jgi:CTP:phosphocholine cytidylyltransferase-like protein